MKYLPDTHAVLYIAESSPRLSAKILTLAGKCVEHDIAVGKLDPLAEQAPAQYDAARTMPLAGSQRSLLNFGRLTQRCHPTQKKAARKTYPHWLQDTLVHRTLP